MLESGHREAADLLAEVELSLDHSDETRAAVGFQGVIMRKHDESSPGVDGNPADTTWYFIVVTSGPYVGKQGWAYTSSERNYLQQ